MGIRSHATNLRLLRATSNPVGPAIASGDILIQTRLVTQKAQKNVCLTGWRTYRAGVAPG